MKLYEEFKLYENMWDDLPGTKKQSLKEWKDSSGKQVRLGGTTAGITSSQSASSTTTQSANNIYVIFNYYMPNDLDDFCMLLAESNKATAVNALIDMAEQSVENYGRYKNTLVCYKIDPDYYDLTANDFIDAAEDKYYYGPDLHGEHTEVVYALSSMAAYKKPLYKLDRPIVEIEFYEEFLSQTNNPTGITIDDIYDSGFDEDLISQVYNDVAFQKFMKNKLTTDINKAL